MKQLAITFQDAPNGPLKQLIFDEGKTAEVVPGVDAPAPAVPVAVPVPVAVSGDNKQAVGAPSGGGGGATAGNVSRATWMHVCMDSVRVCLSV